MDVGIAPRAAENLRAGNVWRRFVAKRESTRAMSAAGPSHYAQRPPG